MIDLVYILIPIVFFGLCATLRPGLRKALNHDRHDRWAVIGLVLIAYLLCHGPST